MHFCHVSVNLGSVGLGPVHSWQVCGAHISDAKHQICALLAEVPPGDPRLRLEAEVQL